MSGRKLVSADTAFVRRRKTYDRDSRMARHVPCRRGLRCSFWTRPALHKAFCSCCSLVVKPNNTTRHPLDTWVKIIKVQADFVPLLGCDFDVNGQVHGGDLPAESRPVCLVISHKTLEAPLAPSEVQSKVHVGTD